MKQFKQGLILSSVFLFFCSTVFAQHIYGKLAYGYGLAMGKMNIDYNYDIHYSAAVNTLDEKFENIRTSFGAGSHFSGNIGYCLTKNVSFELGASYLASNIIKATHTYHYYMGNDVFTYTYKGRSIIFSPSLIVLT